MKVWLAKMNVDGDAGAKDWPVIAKKGFGVRGSVWGTDDEFEVVVDKATVDELMMSSSEAKESVGPFSVSAGPDMERVVPSMETAVLSTATNVTFAMVRKSDRPSLVLEPGVGEMEADITVLGIADESGELISSLTVIIVAAGLAVSVEEPRTFTGGGVFSPGSRALSSGLYVKPPTTTGKKSTFSCPDCEASYLTLSGSRLSSSRHCLASDDVGLGWSF